MSDEVESVNENGKTERKHTARYYVREGDGLVRIIGGEEEPCAMGDVDLTRLAYEGYIWLRTRGFSHEQIISGAAFPDRSLPMGRGGPRPGVTDDVVRAAIAQMKAAEPGYLGDAREWAASLDDHQVNALKDLKPVKAIIRAMTGKTQSLDEILAANAPEVTS